MHISEMQHYKIISEMYSIVKQHILTSLVSSALGLSLHESLLLIKSQYIICCNKIFRTMPEVQAVLQQLCDVLQLVNKIGKCMYEAWANMSYNLFVVQKCSMVR